MKAPRVAPLEDASTSTVTPVDCVHTYASALAYVDGRPQGAQPLTYAPAGAYVSMHCGGHDADERRFDAWAYIAFVRLFLSAAPCKNQEASPQRAQSPQRAGCAGGESVMGGVGGQLQRQGTPCQRECLHSSNSDRNPAC
jgi:hypothetical protein